MTLSLRTRMLIGYVTVVLVAMGVFAWLVSRAQRDWFADQHHAALARLSRIVARDATAVAPGREDAFADSIGALLGCRVTLVRRDGVVLGDSQVETRDLGAVANHAGRPEIVAALAGRVGRSERRSSTVGRAFVYAAVPATAATIAVVRLSEPMRGVLDAERQLAWLTLAAAATAALLSAPLLVWVIGRSAGRIRTLERVAARMGDNDPSARALEQPADELGRLGRALNRTAAEGRLRLEALERERDERESILAHLSDGVALIGPDGRVLRMNRALAARVGADRPPAPGTPLPSVVRWPELDELLRDVRAEGRAREIELRLWTPSPRLLRVAASPLGGANQGLVLLVMRDLSELEALSRVRQDFVANVSHELRTPLTSLRGYAETLLEGGLDDVEHREGFVRVIRDQAVLLEAMVEDLLSLAALERPGARLRLERFDLREAAERLVQSLAPRAERAGLALALEPGAAVEVLADRTQIEQAVVNLVDNALKYTERGAVTVRLGADGARAWLEVEDTGPGIPEDDQPRIFERFYRVDKARSREKGGTGLGLSIVKHVLVLHGGQVSVTSRPGHGARFRIEFPREAEQRPA